MAESLDVALARTRSLLLDADALVRAVASGRRRGAPEGRPAWRRVELRYVDLKAGRHLQVTAYDATQAHTSNHAAGSADAAAAVDALLDDPFAHWHVDTTTQQHQLRVTKRGEALAHTRDRAEQVEAPRGHDRDKDRLLPADDPVLRALGIADAQGRVKPSRQAKYRQVEEFCRLLDTAVGDAIERGHLRRPTPEDPLRVVDLGCGNAYLTFAAHRFLSAVRGLPVHLVGIDVKEQSREHNSRVAADLGVADELTFLVGSIAEAQVPDELGRPEVVLALHACDTATDEALARAVEWDAPLVLAAPCCHHDVAAQLRRGTTPAPYQELTRHGILRERLADTLTDGVRASLLRREGYRVEVVQFVESQHTPRNTLLRAVRVPATGAGAAAAETAVEEYAALVADWGIRPRLGELLDAAPRTR
ncbi:SAM-dependent methyltransferase [Nocardioides zeae]|uniref:SAM-dependent methyltransferase n=1 Tax=Nocardioides imazamoxiresistens TaxID=3231893 RepID=A0ABU3PS47_9ACTN|nr:SAM-dependent methyltransferase [Nocardioides zeae]MDT9592019.1 SAM-dependent methyltransferase [Nocardioides zeae]